MFSCVRPGGEATGFYYIAFFQYLLILMHLGCPPDVLRDVIYIDFSALPSLSSDVPCCR